MRGRPISWTDKHDQLHPSGAPYASWWQRAGAEIIDGLLVGIPLGIALSILSVDGASRTFVMAAAAFVYNALLDGGPSGQTVGKQLVKIRVRSDETGDELGIAGGIRRAGVVFVLSGSNYGIGEDSSGVFLLLSVLGLLDILWPLWDARKQSWHDKVAGSVVVRDIGLLEGP